MLSSRSGGQPRGARGRVQAGCGLDSGTSGLRCGRAPLLALLLAGCSSLPASINPVSWWHDLQGGKIAEERPPPPGADQPYPNLATVPPKPAQPDRAALTNISNALIADRANAQHIAAAAPIADPSLPSASPGLFGRGTVPPPPPPGSAQASASMAAAEAPPAPATPSPPANGPEAAAPAKAPVSTVQSTPLAPPGAAQEPPAVEAAPPPPLPVSPPPPANLPGVASIAPSPAAAPALPPAPPAPAVPVAAAPADVPPPPPAPAPEATPASPPAAPTTVATGAPAPPSPPSPANTVSVTFVTGSAELPAVGTDTLKQLAGRRGSGIIAVTGFGDAASNEPDAQSAALALGLSRAKAMAAALAAAGVPASAVQVDAAAIGRGGTARLVQ